jgi:hypothetical protein
MRTDTPTIACVYDALTAACSACGVRMPHPHAVRNCFPQSSPPLPAPPTHGPGTELSKLLKRFGIEPTPTCACRAKAAEMDAWGCDEASRPERIEEVVAVMRAEAEARGLPFLDVAGRLLVRRAIQNARRNA